MSERDLGATESAGAGQKHPGSNAGAHTPTPWRVVDDHPSGSCLFVVAPSRYVKVPSARDEVANIFDCEADYEAGRNGNLSRPHRRANAERIVACVNACEGIADPSAIPELIAVVGEVLDSTRGFYVMEKLRAALSKVEGR